MNPSITPIIVGPTGSGKTAVGLELARRLGNADVISADSRQIYRHLTIGTAKPRGEWVDDPRHIFERYYDVEGVPHHLMDFAEPTEPYNAGLFAKEAEKIAGALPGERRPVVVGGTGLYLRAWVDGLAPLPKRDEQLREKLNESARLKGRTSLHEELGRVDPAAARRIPANNLARVIRALEVFHLTGKPLTWWQTEKTVPSSRAFVWFGLSWPKAALEKHLSDRCRKMLKDGLLEETDALLKKGVPPAAPAFQALGYRQAIAFLQNELSKEDLEKNFIHETRLYVKRQMTWFRANPRIRWLTVDPPWDAERLVKKAVLPLLNEVVR